MQTAPYSTPHGVNLVGYIRSDFGLGQIARSIALALSKTPILWSIVDYEQHNRSPKENRDWEHKLTNDFTYDINIININADQLPDAIEAMPDSVNRYNIGVWFWELPEFPDKYAPAFHLVDELWAPSGFIGQSLRAKSPVPVVDMPVPVQLESAQQYDRAYFGVPDGQFLFLSMYDVLSLQERKNPEAALAAFLEAFGGGNDSRAGLVIKINNSDYAKDEVKALKERLSAHSNVYIIDRDLSRGEVNGLIECCDATLSLHRSEGLGLLMAEGMYFSKPAVATYWSGNVDFMTVFNSCPVSYDLVRIGQDIGPYEAQQLWAQPDVYQAAEYMKKLVSDPQYYDRIAKRARRDMLENYSPDAVANRMVRRLEQIWQVVMAKP